MSDQQETSSKRARLSHHSDIADAAISSGASLSTADAAASNASNTASLIHHLPEQYPISERVRRSARLKCEMNRLADVELQLVLQFLTNTDRLKAARVSRRMCGQASQPFSWKFAETITISSDAPADFARVASSLIRYAPMRLEVRSFLNPSQVAQLPSLSHVVLTYVPLGLRFSSHKQICLLLQKHPLQSLIVHSRYGWLDSSTVQLLSSKTTLHTLKLMVGKLMAPSYFAPLSNCTSLTELTVDGTPLHGSRSKEEPLRCMASLSACTSLRRLSISNVCFSHGQFRSVLSSPNLSSLKELSFCCFSAGADDPLPESTTSDDWRSAFANLQQLEHLTLSRSTGPAAMLQHVPILKSLLHLSLTVQSPHRSGFEVSPSRSALEAVLAALPLLNVHLHVLEEVDEVHEMYALPRITLIFENDEASLHPK